MLCKTSRVSHGPELQDCAGALQYLRLRDTALQKALQGGKTYSTCSEPRPTL